MNLFAIWRGDLMYTKSRTMSRLENRLSLYFSYRRHGATRRTAWRNARKIEGLISSSAATTANNEMRETDLLAQMPRRHDDLIKSAKAYEKKAKEMRAKARAIQVRQHERAKAAEIANAPPMEPIEAWHPVTDEWPATLVEERGT